MCSRVALWALDRIGPVHLAGPKPARPAHEGSPASAPAPHVTVRSHGGLTTTIHMAGQIPLYVRLSAGRTGRN
ncbi:hypothetical protein M2163_000730 [Streptomyces sp. SAI-135]|nr:hypothetical protein [Streptomyces sp. SAI-090]MDH6554384.1 hypothetical protein [Streptomyces sp. SAI-041]MDH6573650.1 hypothetical protein [Streptomyces sp. SAI-117]MDH6581617.1 hypothetical protein [Streptomyces sp. SAI-133]MDH6613622.1 hypothetical protein [Streptomyces sp. SAI-135]